MAVINTEIPWRQWVDRIRGLLPSHDGYCDLAEQEHPEVRITPQGYRLYAGSRAARSLAATPLLFESRDESSLIAKILPQDKVLVSIDQDLCFCHKVAIPATARRQAAQMLALERTRTTPFEPAEIFAAHHISEETGPAGWLVAEGVVFKRRLVDALWGALQRAGIGIAGVIVRDGLGRALPMALDHDGAVFGCKAFIKWKRITLVSAMALAVVCLAALGVQQQKLERRLASIEVATAGKAEIAASVEAQLDGIRSRTAEVQALQHLRRTKPRATDVIESLSAALPDDSSLETLTLNGTLATIEGMSARPEPLISALEERDEFSQVSFVSPVFRNSGEERSHFTIKLVVESAALQR
jgi:general secretion pathway protein L